MSDFTELVAVENGKPATTSLKIAEVFGKQHKDVLKAIRELEIPEDFNRRNFSPVDYTDAKGEKRPMYLITRDGFTLLAMGFTGEKAMKFKLAYIAAFNAMEKAIFESRRGMLTIEEVLAKFEPVIRENERLKHEITFAKHFLPHGKPGDLNERGLPKNQYRSGYYCARNGHPVALLIVHEEQPELFFGI